MRIFFLVFVILSLHISYARALICGPLPPAKISLRNASNYSNPSTHASRIGLRSSRSENVSYEERFKAMNRQDKVSWEAVVEEIAMLPRNLSPNSYLVSLNKIMADLVRTNSFRSAILLLNQMKSEGPQPDVFTYSTIINACAKRGDIQRVMNFLNEMIESGAVPNVITYNSALDGCSKAKDCVNAEKLISDMESRGIKPNVITWNRIIDTFGKANRLDVAIEKFQAMKKSGEVPNIKTYTCLMSAAAVVGNIEKTISIYDEMIQNGIQPDTVIYGSIINAYAVSGKYEEAEETFSQMCSSGISPNSVTYGAIIKACCIAGNLPRAQEWLKRLQNDGLVVNIKIWSTIIHAAYQLGDAVLVKQLYEQALESGTVNPYKKKGSTTVLDLHNFNVGMAIAAVYKEVSALKKRQVDHLIIVTGRGQKGGDPKLKITILSLLNKIGGIKHSFTDDMKGMIQVNIV